MYLFPQSHVKHNWNPSPRILNLVIEISPRQFLHIKNADSIEKTLRKLIITYLDIGSTSTSKHESSEFCYFSAALLVDSVGFCSLANLLPQNFRFVLLFGCFLVLLGVMLTRFDTALTKSRGQVITFGFKKKIHFYWSDLHKNWIYYS